jgi:uncharacterized DUF497 family protein
MLSVRRLIWDAWNVAHIARHDVIPEEVEEVCHDQPVTSETYKGRLRVVGLTQSGRILTVILAPTPEAGVYYPITARPADRKERRNYREEHS